MIQQQHQDLIWFEYFGDEVAYDPDTCKWISLGFTGNGDFGDATFDTLEDIEKMWIEYENA